MDIVSFQEKLKDYVEQLKLWSEPITQLKQSWQHKPISGPAELDKYYQEIENVTKQQRTKYDLPELINSFLDEHYQVYLESTPDECSTVRAVYKSSIEFQEFLLFSYVRRAVSQLELTGDEIWLLRGLVAMSLENCGDDYRDTLTALAELFVTAEKYEIAPKSSFQRVANLSSREKPRGGQTPVQEIMMNFDNYSIVQERRRMGKSYWDKEK